MSDYLGHLLERSFTLALHVRPKTPALFEPPPSTRMVEHPADFDLESNFEKTAATPPTHDQPRNISAAQSDKPSSPAREPVSPSTDETRIPSARSHEPGDQTVRPLIPAKIEAVTTPTKIPAGKPATPRPETSNGFKPSGQIEHTPAEAPKIITVTSQELPPVPARSDKITPFEIPAPVSSATRAASDRETGKISPAVSSRPAISRQSRVVEEHNFERSPKDQLSSPAPGIRPRSVIVATQIPAPAASAANSGRTNGNHPTATSRRMQHERNYGEVATSAPPTIQVTIGRVEVRATAPATTPSRARSRKEPEMSLETYLQRRAEGGRR